MFILLGCAVWPLLTFGIIWLVGQMVMGEIDALTGLVAILLGVFLGFNIYGNPEPILRGLAAGAIVLTFALWFPARALMERGADRAMLVEQVEMTYDRLNANPNDVVAQFRLARQFETLGHLHFAAALAQRVAPGLPKATFREEHALTARWSQIAANRPVPLPIPCEQCRTPIRPGAIGCPSCGRAFGIDLARGRNGAGRAARKVLAVWAILLAVLIGLPSLASYGPAVAVPGAVILLIAAIGVVVVAFRPTSRA